MHIGILGLAIAILLIILYYILNRHFTGITYFKYDSTLKESSIEIPPSDIINGETTEFAYSMWIKMDKWQKNGEYILFDRISEMKLYLYDSALRIDTSYNDKDKGITLMDNFPLHKWIYLAFSVRKSNATSKYSILDFYVDGKLLKSMKISSINPSNAYGITLGNGVGESRIVGLQRWKYPATPYLVISEYNKSNKLQSSVDYGAELNIFKDSKLANNIVIY